MSGRKSRGALVVGLWMLALAGSTACSPARDDAASPPAPDVTKPHPPLIVLIVLDTLRADHLGTYGHKRFTSPVLDAFAAEGVVFEDASSTAPWTLPSNASILTGRFPLAHRVTSPSVRLRPEIPTLASILGAAGYRTAAAVNVAWLRRETYGLTRDFDDYLFVPAFLDRRSPSRLVTDQALAWIDAHGDRPLLLFLHYYDVHADYAAEPAYERLFVTPYEGPADGTSWQLKQAILDEDFIASCHENFDEARCSFGGHFVIDRSVEKLHFNADDVRHLEELYDAQIRQLDAELGRLFAQLSRRGLLEEALIIVTADHGEEFADHGSFEHFITTYQEMLHVPLLMRGPGIPAGLRVDAPVSSIDLVPTIAAAAGATLPEGVEGLDLASFWSGGDGSPFYERALHAEASGGHVWDVVAPGLFPSYRSIRRGRFKLVHRSSDDAFALYDLVADPGEHTDLSTRFPEQAASLRSEMERRRERLERRPRNGDAVAPDLIERLRELGYVP